MNKTDKENNHISYPRRYQGKTVTSSLTHLRDPQTTPIRQDLNGRFEEMEILKLKNLDNNQQLDTDRTERTLNKQNYDTNSDITPKKEKHSDRLESDLTECKVAVDHLKKQMTEFNDIYDKKMTRKNLREYPRIKEKGISQPRENEYIRVIKSKEIEINQLKDRIEEYGNLMINLKNENFNLVENISLMKRSKKMFKSFLRKKIVENKFQNDAFYQLQLNVEQKERKFASLAKHLSYLKSSIIALKQKNMALKIQNQNREREGSYDNNGILSSTRRSNSNGLNYTNYEISQIVDDNKYLKEMNRKMKKKISHQKKKIEAMKIGKEACFESLQGLNSSRMHHTELNEGLKLEFSRGKKTVNF